MNRPQRLILASSSSVYGVVDDHLMRESDETTPLSPYGVTKLAAEKLCLVYAQEYSISTAILRFFSVFGPRQRPDMLAHKLLTAASDQESISIFGSLDQRRDFTYVSDIVRACSASIEMVAPTAIINVASGAPVSLAECIRVAEALTGRSIPLVMTERQAGDVANTHGDISKARVMLNYSPLISFQDGLRRQWEWMLTERRAHAQTVM
jgi:nucleoside-diphosphate-sugar epimerase